MSNKSGPSAEELQEMVNEGNPQVIQLITENRKKGLAGLEKKLDDLKASVKSAMEGATNGGSPTSNYLNTMRNIEGALDSVLVHVEANNSLVDMLVHDLTGAVHNLEQTQKAHVVGQTYVQVLLNLLMKKGVITDEQMRETWEELAQASRQSDQE